MPVKLKKIVRAILFTGVICVCLLFLLACLAPYANPDKWWLIAMLGFGFSALVLLVFLSLVYALLLKKRWWFIPALTLLLGIKSIRVFFAFHSPAAFKEQKAPGSIRIATWNVARFIELKKNNNKGSQARLLMLDQLKQQNADVLCLQEFQTSSLPDYYDNLTYIQQELHYPYHYFIEDEDGDQLFYSSIIFSRYPIMDTGFLRYPRPSLPDVLIYADLKINKRIMRVYTTHLQSVQFKKNDYRRIEEIKDGDKGMIDHSKIIFSKLRTAMARRKMQVDIIQKVMGDSPYATVFCGDLNDIPNSYTYFNVRGNMQDVFLKKGFGFGRTFSSISPTLRIDYIFADDHFNIKQFKRINRKTSDHYMLVSDVEFAKN